MKKTDFEIAKEFASRLREQLGEVSVIVYGSRVREDSELFSDMDICVIVEKMNRETKEIIFTIAWETGFEKDIIIVPLIFEKNEWENSPISESPIHNNIQKEGIKI